MATAVTVRADFSTDELRRLAAASKHANQSRRLLSLAAVLDGMSRADAARPGCRINRQAISRPPPTDIADRRSWAAAAVDLVQAATGRPSFT
jgi:hypothetical protein